MKFKNYSIIILHNENNEIFIQDRTSISKWPEKWWFFGWWVEAWETFEEALVREAMEELNIDISKNHKYIWTTIFELEWFWIQKTNIYLVKYEKEFDNYLKVLEWDGWKFLSLENIQKLQEWASWSYMCVEMLKEYFSKK